MSLQNLGVQEMNAMEITETEGGFFGFDDIIVGVVVGGAIAVISDWENFKAGLSGKAPVPR